MRPIVEAFARDVAEGFPIARPVVEMGARTAAGQEHFVSMRELFGTEDYIGCDIQEGRNVDRIEDIHHLTFADDSVGTIICLETLEHVADPIRAVGEMHRVLRPGGLLAISSLMCFPIHEHPWDFWRFTPEGFGKLLEPFASSIVLAHGYDLIPEGIFGVGIKADDGPPTTIEAARLPRLSAACERWGKHLPIDLGPIRMSLRQAWGITLRATGDELRKQVRRRARIRR